MKTHIDVKSLMLGALLTALVALSVAAAAGTSPRFQISAWGFAGPNRSGHGAYVLDTATGEVWVVHETGAQKKIAEKLK